MEVRAFVGFHSTDRYAALPFEKQFEHLMRLGCDGIKLIDMAPSLYLVNGHGINHESYDRAEKVIPFVGFDKDPEQAISTGFFERVLSERK